MEALNLRNQVTQLYKASIAGSMSAPGPVTRYRDATSPQMSPPSTPAKERYEPFHQFQLSSPGPQEDEPTPSKKPAAKKNKKGEKTKARKALKIKVPDGKKTVVPRELATPSKKLDVSSTCPDLRYQVLTTNNSLPISPATRHPASPTS
jgi:hypothetical protein